MGTALACTGDERFFVLTVSLFAAAAAAACGALRGALEEELAAEAEEERLSDKDEEREGGRAALGATGGERGNVEPASAAASNSGRKGVGVSSIG